MTTATVVIGAALGDEGNGLLTDHHAQPGTLVVRFNGGSRVVARRASWRVFSPSGQRR